MHIQANLAALGLLAGLALSPARAQSRWKEIGKTSAGNSVYVDPATVKKANGIITARLRVKFTTPVDAGNGTKWFSSQHIAMFDCAKRTLAAKENIYYSDYTGSKVVSRSVNKIPGYGPAIDGSMSQVALDHFCPKK